MTKNKKIFVNVLATYGRSLFALVCGLFSSRWALMALGATDYGLYAVTGTLTTVITFLNGMFSGAVGRYYAYFVGEAQIPGNESAGLENCRKWFNTAVFLHIVTPLLTTLIGYPLGVWLIENWLSIPSDRVFDCVWVFRFSVIATFVSIASVPFNAMFVAKQNIAELTLYSIIGTIANVIVLAFMVTHPGSWLRRYAALMCVISVVPNSMIIWRAVQRFEECSFARQYLISKKRILQLSNFVFLTSIGIIGYMVKSQGIVFLVNKMFGPRFNATLGVSQAVQGHTNSLSAAMSTAFMPAITNEVGAGNVVRAEVMAFRAGKFGVFLCGVFAIPLICELDLVLKLWLKTPPMYLTETTFIMLCGLIVCQSTIGIDRIVHAIGKIGMYNVVTGIVGVLFLPLCIVVVKCFHVGYVGVILFMTAYGVFQSLVSLALASRIINFPSQKLLVHIVLRSMMIIAFVLGVVLSLRGFFAGLVLLRVFVSLLTSFTLFCFLSFEFLFDGEEREYLFDRIRSVVRRLSSTFGIR